MPKITFLPLGKTVEAEIGQTILEVAMDNDIEIQHACGGNCACSTCMIIVKEGELSEKDEDTEGIFTMGEGERLACQARVASGDAVVEIQ